MNFRNRSITLVTSYSARSQTVDRNFIPNKQNYYENYSDRDAQKLQLFAVPDAARQQTGNGV
jgi:hypothetical protein